MAKTITKQQYLQLVGLLTLAERYNGELREIERAATEITGEDREDWGHTSDAVYGLRSIDDLLEFLNITVETVETPRDWEEYYDSLDRITAGH